MSIELGASTDDGGDADSLSPRAGGALYQQGSRRYAAHEQHDEVHALIGEINAISSARLEREASLHRGEDPDAPVAAEALAAALACGGNDRTTAHLRRVGDHAVYMASVTQEEDSGRSYRASKERAASAGPSSLGRLQEAAGAARAQARAQATARAWSRGTMQSVRAPNNTAQYLASYNQLQAWDSGVQPVSPGAAAATVTFADEADVLQGETSPGSGDTRSPSPARDDTGIDGTTDAADAGSPTPAHPVQCWSSWQHWRRTHEVEVAAAEESDSDDDDATRTKCEAARALWGVDVEYPHAMDAAQRGAAPARKLFVPEVLFERFSWRRLRSGCLDLRPWVDELDSALVQYIAALAPEPGPSSINMARCGTGGMATRKVLLAIGAHMGANLRSLDLTGALDKTALRCGEHASAHLASTEDVAAAETEAQGVGGGGDTIVKVVLCAHGRFSALLSLSLADTPTLTDGALRSLGHAALHDPDDDTAVGVRSSPAALRSLVELDLSACPLLTDDGMLALLGVQQVAAGANELRVRSQRARRGALVTRLRVLGISGCILLGDGTFFALSQGAFSLTGERLLSGSGPLCALDATDLGRLTDAGLAALFGSCGALEALRLGGCGGVGDDGFGALMQSRRMHGLEPTKSFSAMKYLVLRNIGDGMVGDLTVSYIAAACPQLETLDLAGSGKWLHSAAALEALRSMRTVRELCLAGCATFDNDAVLSIFGAAGTPVQGSGKAQLRPPRSGITSLDLRGCAAVGSTGVRAIASACRKPGLRRLALSHCNAVDDGAMRFLVKHASTTLQALSVTHMGGIGRGGGTSASMDAPDAPASLRAAGSDVFFQAVSKHARQLVHLSVAH